MRIATTGFLTAAILAAAITPGWCPEPADLDAPISGGTGAVALPPPDARSYHDQRHKLKQQPNRPTIETLRVYSPQPNKFNQPGNATTRLTSPWQTSPAMERLGAGGGASTGPYVGGKGTVAVGGKGTVVVGGKGTVSSSAATMKTIPATTTPQTRYQPVQHLGVKRSVPDGKR